MTFRVKPTKASLADAERIYEYVTTAAPLRGPLWYRLLLAAIESLQQFPERCSRAPESPAFPFEVRQLFFGRKPNVYRVLFTIEDDTVIILQIRGPRQQPLEP